MTPLVVTLTVLVAGQIATMGAYGMYRLGRRSRPTPEPAAELGPEIVIDEETEMDWLNKLLMETVIVHTDVGLSYEGLLALVTDKGLMLRNPKLMDEQRSPTAMGGELWIDRPKIHGVQTKPAELTQLPTP